MRRRVVAVLILGLLVAAIWGQRHLRHRALDTSGHRVYVILGFHNNFSHSWRGDTPDEVGFGTDIRVVREILRILNRANEAGLEARAYWDSDNYFTLETILPRHAPDIIEGIRERVDAGLDEVVLAPYNNGLFSAMTEDEVRSSVRWAVSNPWGSGVADLFGKYTPLLRPNEGMATTGLVPILLEEGVRGLILPYSSYPFTAFSNFVPTLPPEQRYNPTWLRLRPGGPRILLFPSVSVGDVLNQISLEKWLLELRRLQLEGVERDLVLHINFDADSDAWLPADLPPGLGWFPNSGGLEEYIRAVNQYPWAELTTPGRYLELHEPVGEVVVRQDLADGPWDGNYAWAEKLPSHGIWTAVARSRLYTRWAEALLEPGQADSRSDSAPSALLLEGRDSSFFQRLLALSTTHFGMSTPLVNEERQAVAERIAGRAASQAEAAVRVLGDRLAAAEPAAEGALYSFRVQDLRSTGSGGLYHLLRIPVILPRPPPLLVLVDGDGAERAFSLTDVQPLAGEQLAAHLTIPLSLDAGERLTLHLEASSSGSPASTRRRIVDRLANAALELTLSPENGISAVRLDGRRVAGVGFLAPFITYRSHKRAEVYATAGYELAPLDEEAWNGVGRARLLGRIPFPASHGPAQVDLDISLTLPDGARWWIADVEVAYPYTRKDDLLNNLQQKLRRYLDLRWQEVAPFQLHPELHGTRQRPLRVWKHNYLGVTSSYELDYGRINPENSEVDAFNHQVTAGWVAVSDGERGLLVAQSAQERSSYAFVCMRLREEGGEQRLWLNPFGSYWGRQLDYSHLGGTGLGSELALLAGGQFYPNAPSYNGMRERFSVLVAPYTGDEPPDALQAEAEAFFTPPAVIYLAAPVGFQSRLPEDVRRRVAGLRSQEALANDGQLSCPRAFLVNPTAEAVDVVWDPPAHGRAKGYEIDWAPVPGDWNRVRIGATTRYHLGGLTHGVRYRVRLRATAGDQSSPWTETAEVTVAPVPPQPLTASLQGADSRLLLRIAYYGLVHALTTP